VRITWTGPDGAVRHGEIWSPGPLGGAVWVIPDQPRTGEGRAVCVGLDGRLRAALPRWSTQAHQDDVHLTLPAAAALPAPTERGGQLRARIAPQSRKDHP
jgi:hypothetical protein